MDTYYFRRRQRKYFQTFHSQSFNSINIASLDEARRSYKAMNIRVMNEQFKFSSHSSAKTLQESLKFCPKKLIWSSWLLTLICWNFIIFYQCDFLVIGIPLKNEVLQCKTSSFVSKPFLLSLWCDHLYLGEILVKYYLCYVDEKSRVGDFLNHYKFLVQFLYSLLLL